jgi:hypothetical protein
MTVRMHNCALTRVSSHEACGTTYFTFYSAPDLASRDPLPLNGPVMVGEYSDRFVLTKHGWRFSERVVVPQFKRDS